jgi:hypothetical protein
MNFGHVWLLYLLWLVPAVAAGWYALHKMHEKSLERFLSATMQTKLRPVVSQALFLTQAALVCAGLFLLIVAAARPQWGSREEIVHERGRDLLIVLDVSRSMLANDVHPNRLRRAKADIMDLVRELRGDRAGLIAFRRKAVSVCPLTTDYAYLKQALDAISVGSAPRGQTDIGAAIETALDSFDSESGSHKAIILVSDGEDLSGHAVKAAEKAAEKGIPVFTVGLGSTRGAPVPDDKEGTTRYQGKEVITRLENETLYKIAQATRGAYIPIGTAGTTTTTLGTIYRKHLQQIAAKELEETLHRRAVERYQWFLFPALLLLTAACLLSRGRLAVGKPAAKRAKPSPRGEARHGQVSPLSSSPRDITPPREVPRILATLLAFILVGSTALQAQTNTPPVASTNTSVKATSIPAGRAGARMAQSLYRRGRYPEAAAAYLAAARDAGVHSQYNYRYNAALAYLQAGQYKESLDLLRELLLEGGEANVDTATALGKAAYQTAAEHTEEAAEDLAKRVRLLQEAGEAFRSAASSHPSDAETARNLAVLKQKLSEARETAHIAALLEKYKDQSASSIAATMLASQQELVESIPAAFTNTTPARIALLEELSEKQRNNADLWVPLKGKLLQAMASPQDEAAQKQLAAVNELAEHTRDNMLAGADSLRDLDPSAYGPAVSSQAAIYGLWKGIAAYPEILKEDLRRQSNALTATVSGELTPQPGHVAPADNQKEAAVLTRLFTERFTTQVPDPGSNAPPAQVQENSETNAAAISAETRARILELSDQTEATQARALTLLESSTTSQAVEQQKQAYALLKEIEELLPKQKQQQQQPDKQQQQEQQQEQEQQQQQEQQPKDSPPEQDPQQQEPEKQDQDVPEDVQQMLDKALQREKEHEEEKIRRQQFVPLPALEKDW